MTHADYYDIEANHVSTQTPVFPIWSFDEAVVQVEPLDDADFSTAVFEVVTAADPDSPFVSCQPSITLNSSRRLVRIGMMGEIVGPFIRVKVTTAEGSAQLVRVTIRGWNRE